MISLKDSIFTLKPNISFLEARGKLPEVFIYSN